MCYPSSSSQSSRAPERNAKKRSQTKFLALIRFKRNSWNDWAGKSEFWSFWKIKNRLRLKNKKNSLWINTKSGLTRTILWFIKSFSKARTVNTEVTLTFYLSIIHNELSVTWNFDFHANHFQHFVVFWPFFFNKFWVSLLLLFYLCSDIAENLWFEISELKFSVARHNFLLK